MVTALTIAIAAGGLTGCVSTQRKNARAELVANRTLAARTSLRLHRRSREVRVEHVALVRAAHGGAFVVTLRNRGAQPATDVPIAVGLRAADGRRTQLDGGSGLGWFRTHVPAIGAGASTTWVFTARRPLPAGTPYAIAGATGGTVVSRASGALPAISARVVPESVRGRRGARTRGGVLVGIVNRSEIPQYDVQVYAVARAGGRVLAAGAASIAHLGTHEGARVRVALGGAAGHHTVRVFALPTIFE